MAGELADILVAVNAKDAPAEVKQLANALAGTSVAIDCQHRRLVIDHMSLSIARELLAPGSTGRTLPGREMVLEGGLRIWVSKVADQWDEVHLEARMSEAKLSVGRSLTSTSLLSEAM